jgi:hypothetical protein
MNRFNFKREIAVIALGAFSTLMVGLSLHLEITWTNTILLSMLCFFLTFFLGNMFDTFSKR